MSEAVQLGEEGKRLDDSALGVQALEWPERLGLCEVQLNGEQDYEMVITDLNNASASEKKFTEPPSAMRVDLPDGRFATSMQSQISHLIDGHRSRWSSAR
jgi:hypothetical protein